VHTGDGGTGSEGFAVDTSSEDLGIGRMTAVAGSRDVDDRRMIQNQNSTNTVRSEGRGRWKLESLMIGDGSGTTSALQN
jgi:hypothetical protein